jgi:hypothetical protein
VECKRVFDSKMYNDTLEIKLFFTPCDAHGSSISLDNLDYKVENICAGDEVNLPIPGVLGMDKSLSHCSRPPAYWKKVS